MSTIMTDRPVIAPGEPNHVTADAPIFLWRATFPLNQRTGRDTSSNTHHLHRLTLVPYPATDHPRTRNNVLWRIDAHGPTADLTVQSTSEPNLDNLINHPLWDPTWNLTPIINLTPTLNRLTVGTIIRYRLRANPTKADAHNRHTTGGRGRPTPITDPEGLTTWVTNRLTAALTIPTDPYTGTPAILTTTRSPVHTNKPDGRPITLTTADYEGTATITHPDTLKHLLHHGIGRGRAYGLGQLQAQPIN